VSQASTTRTNALDRVYAQAFFSLAQEKGQLEEVADEAAQIGQLIAESPELSGVVSSKVIRPVAKATFIEKVFAGKVSDTTYKFLQVVNRKDRLSELPTILVAFQDLLDQAAGKQAVSITVAQELTSDALGAVRDQLATALSKDVSVEQSVDASLIGGVVVKIGDRLIDGSVSTRLKTLKTQLMAAGSQAGKKHSA